MADKGAQLALAASLPDDLLKVGGDTYTPFVYVPVNYGANAKYAYEINTGADGTPPPTEGQLWPRGNS